MDRFLAVSRTFLNYDVLCIDPCTVGALSSEANELAL